MLFSTVLVNNQSSYQHAIETILSYKAVFRICEKAQELRNIRRIVQTHKPDLLIISLAQLKTSDIDIIEQFSSVFPNLKILLISNNIDELKKEIELTGAALYIKSENIEKELPNALEIISSAFSHPNSDEQETIFDKRCFHDCNRFQIVVKTKLHRPSFTNGFINRQQLISKLEANKDKVASLISAPAGYGKSTIVGQWLEQTTTTNAWISIDEEHNDWRSFLRYFICAVEGIFPGSLNQSKSLPELINQPPTKYLSEQLSNELVLIEEKFILAFDDYHKINDLYIHRLLNEIICLTSDKVHISIITRRDPPFSLNKMRAYNELIDIRINDLIFSKAEILELFLLRHSDALDENLISTLHQKTEGWPMGLTFALLITQYNTDINNAILNFEGSLYSISTFLVDEVLGNLSNEVQDIILGLSILDYFNQDLIDAVFPLINKQQTEQKKFFQWLINSDLFIIPLNNNSGWFRFHHLFKGLLNRQLKIRKSNEEIINYYQKISNWYESQNSIYEAILYAIKGNNIERAKNLVINHWIAMINKDQWYDIEKWLSLIPKEEVEKSHSLILINGFIFQTKHQISQIPVILEQLKPFQNKLNETEVGYQLFFLCIASYLMGDANTSLSLAENGLKLIPDEYFRIKSDLRCWWVLSLNALGRYEDAIYSVKQDINLTTLESESILVSRLYAQLAFLHLLTANISGLEWVTLKFQKIKTLSVFAWSYVEYFDASAFWWKNKLEGASQKFEIVIKHSLLSNTNHAIDGFIAKALCLQELRNPVEAKECIKKGILFAEELNDPVIINTAYSGEARLALLQNDIETATKWLDNSLIEDLTLASFYFIENTTLTRCRVLIYLNTKESLNSAKSILDTNLDFAKSNNYILKQIEILLLLTETYTRLMQNNDAINTLKEAIRLGIKGLCIRLFCESIETITNLLSIGNFTQTESTFLKRIIDSTIDNNTNSATPTLKTKEYLADKPSLSRRHIEILNLVAKGYRNKEIAEELYLSTETIKKHLYHIFQKMNVKTRVELIEKAKESKLIPKE